jgi:hypothetical protein
MLENGVHTQISRYRTVEHFSSYKTHRNRESGYTHHQGRCRDVPISHSRRHHHRHRRLVRLVMEQHILVVVTAVAATTASTMADWSPSTEYNDLDNNNVALPISLGIVIDMRSRWRIYYRYHDVSIPELVGRTLPKSIVEYALSVITTVVSERRCTCGRDKLSFQSKQ